MLNYECESFQFGPFQSYLRDENGPVRKYVKQQQRRGLLLHYVEFRKGRRSEKANRAGTKYARAGKANRLWINKLILRF